MPVVKAISVKGGVKLGSADCAVVFPGSEVLSKIDTSYLSSASSGPRAFTLADAVTWVDLLENTGITEAAFVMVKVSGGSVELRRTIGSNVDQIVNVSCLELWISPNNRATALAIRGSADVEIIIAGQ